MTKNSLNIAADPQRFLSHADRVMAATSFGSDKKRQWVEHHLGALVAWAGANGNELTDAHYAALGKLAEAADLVDLLAEQERLRDCHVRQVQKAAEEAAQKAAYIQAWTAHVHADKIREQQERDRIIEQKALAAEANIRLTRIVTAWNRPRMAWYRAVPALRPGAFMDYSYQGAD